MEGHVRKRGDRWYYSFEAASIGGKRKRIERVGGRTKKEAEAALRKAIEEYNNVGQRFDPVEMSVSDYLDYWLREEVEKNKGHNTYLDYERKARKHIKPVLGHYRLRALRPDAIQKWIDDVKSQGYAKSMVTNLLACLSSALGYALLPLGYIERNPCSDVSVPKIKEDPLAKEHTEYICSVQEFEIIIKRFGPGSTFYIPLMLGYHLGTRIGESYGFDLLKDIDFEASTIAIDRQLQYEKGIWYQRPPKYDSNRIIKMGKTIPELLRKEIVRRKEHMLRYGSHFTKTYVRPDDSLVQLKADIKAPPEYREIMPVSVKEDGTLLTPHSFKYCAKVIHYELNNPLFHYHCLRHTHATVLAENGAHPKAIQVRLGHKRADTSMNIYISATEKMQQDAVDIFEKAVTIK